MKLNIERIVIIILLLLGGWLAIEFFTSEPEIIEVPVEIEVPVPVVVKEFDTIEKPVPVYVPVTERVVDSTLLKEYNNLKSEMERDSLFREAITIKEYREKVEDDTIRIDLYAQVRGDLLNYQIGYETKPRTIKLDTTIKVEVPKKPMLFIGGKVNLPPSGNFNPGIGPQSVLVNKKHNKAYSFSYDFVNKQVGVGFLIKF